MLAYRNGFTLDTIYTQDSLKEIIGIIISRVIRESGFWSSVFVNVGFIESLEAALKTTIVGETFSGRRIRDVSISGYKVNDDNSITVGVVISTDFGNELSEVNINGNENS